MSGWRAKLCGLVGLVALAALLAACSPVSRLLVRVILPSGAKADLHVTGAKTCPPGPISAPAPATTPGDAMLVEQNAETGSVNVTTTFRGLRCNASITVWIDSDSNGKPSSGDFVGSTLPIEVRDRGIFSGNLTRGPNLVLSRLP